MPKRKSSSAFRTIGEVASELGVSPHVLRFWESKFSQIKPHKRRGGHRYYRPADIEVIAEIKSLLYDRGFTIKGAQQFLKEQKSAENMADDQSTLFEEVPSTASNVTPLELTTPISGGVALPPSVDKAKIQTLIEELKDIKTLLESEAA